MAQLALLPELLAAPSATSVTPGLRAVVSQPATSKPAATGLLRGNPTPDSPLDPLLREGRVWRGQRNLRPESTQPTGLAALDEVLPFGGWPGAALTELLLPADGDGCAPLGHALRAATLTGGSLLVLPEMGEAVLEQRYDLQYTLYLLALHRLLQARIPDYDYDIHIGGAVYLFLRGIDGPANGVFSDKPPRALIEQLDRLFDGESVDSTAESGAGAHNHSHPSTHGDISAHSDTSTHSDISAHSDTAGSVE